MRFSRRGFVKFSAGSAVGLGLSGLCLEALSDINAAMTEEIYPARGVESFANSMCQLCPGGCGIRVRKIDSRVVQVLGNKNSPVNRGGLCPIGVASTQYLYHPERLRSPLKREQESWEQISWEQALDEIASRLRVLTEQGESQRVVALSHPLTGVLKKTVQHLLRGLGSNNLIELSGPADGLEIALRLMQGVSGRPAYELADCNYLLSIGAEILEDWTSPVWAMKSYADFRGKRPRGRLTYAGPRESVTASKADEWVQIPMGSEGAFALGIAYVLISERLYDFEFVASHCFGFEDWHDENGELRQGFRNLVLAQYPLKRVSELTGVSPEEILKVAREFGSARPAMALAGPITSVSERSILGALCVHSLNALVGSIDRKGGVLLQHPGPLDQENESVEDEVPDFLVDFKERMFFGEDPQQTFERALKREGSQLPSALLLLETDPIFDSYDPESLSEYLKRIPLIVSVSSFLNPTSQLADYVLPAASSFESWAEQSAPPGVWFSYEGLTRPVMEPLGESRSCGNIILALARASKIVVPEEDYAAQLQNHLARLYDLRRGAVSGTVFDQVWHQLMEESGWWAPTYESSRQLLQQMASKGGWWDSFYRYEDWERTLRTASGKFQFYVPEIQPLVISESPQGQTPYLPYFVPLAEREDGQEFPFLVHFFDPLTSRSRQAFLPLVREVAGGHVQNSVGMWVELAEADALQLDIRSGDLVRVESARNYILARAQIDSTVPRGRINIPRGVREESGDIWDTRSTPGSNSLVEKPAGSSYSDWSQTRVRVIRI